MFRCMFYEVDYKFLSFGQTVNKNDYLSFMSNKTRTMGSNNSWFLHNELMIMPGSYITRSSLPFRYNFDVCMSFRNHRIWLFDYSQNSRDHSGERESIVEIKAKSKKALMAIPEGDYLA